MARNNKKGMKSKKAGVGNIIWKVTKEVAGPLVFVEQLTHKDRETMGDEFNDAPITQKAKILVNIIGGRMIGISPFKDEVQAPQTINFSGIFNRWTGLGIALKAYGLTSKGIKVDGKTLLPHGSKLEQLGTRVLTGGVAGGIFDAPPGSGVKSSQTGTRHIKLIGTQPQRVLQRGISQQIVPVLRQEISVSDSAMTSIE